MKRLLLVTLLLSAIAGAVRAQGQSEGMRKLSLADFAITNLYVDEVDENKLVEDAIRGMLDELDPHSTYTTAEETKEMNEPLQGNFSGIGIQFNMNKDTLYVIQTIVGGPSEKVGILAGDRIITVNDTVIAGVKMKNTDIMKRLRGEAGTEVRVSVLRKGEYVGTVQTSEATADSLTEMMVGQKVDLHLERPLPKAPAPRLVLKDVSAMSAEGVRTLDKVNLTVFSGEILGIAGVAGSGQKELLEAIAGLQPLCEGSICYDDVRTGAAEELRGKTPLQIRDLGIHLSFVPEDRLGMGLVGSMGMIGNVMLRSYRSGKGIFTDRKAPRQLAQRLKEQLDIVTPGVNYPVRRLSGGNVQKVLVGREIAAAPTVLMAAYPVRGLDINSSYTIYDLLNQQKEKGVAVIYVGEDLDVMLELCDRIAVLCDGRLTGLVDARKTTKAQVGMLMTRQEKERHALQVELNTAMQALHANEAAFGEAQDPLFIEQLTYQHAALMCRCRALLRALRVGGADP